MLRQWSDLANCFMTVDTCENSLIASKTHEYEVVDSFGNVLWRGRSMSPEFAILSGAHTLGYATMQELRNKKLDLRVREIRTVSVEGYYTVSEAAPKPSSNTPSAAKNTAPKNVPVVVTDPELKKQNTMLRLQIGSLKAKLSKYENNAETTRRGILIARAAKKRMEKSAEFNKELLKELRSIIRSPEDRGLFDFSPLNEAKS